MNPVHSSPFPLCEPGHFQAMKTPSRLLYSSDVRQQVNATQTASCRNKLLNGWALVNFRATKRWLVRILLHQAIVKAHKLRVIVILQHELAWPDSRLLSQKHFCSEMPLQLL